MDVETATPLLAMAGSMMAAVGTALLVQCGKSRQQPKGKTASLKGSKSKSASEKKSKKSKRENPKSASKKPLEQSAKKHSQEKNKSEKSAKTAKPIEKTQSESSKSSKPKVETKDVEELNVELGNKAVVLQPGELHFKPNGGLQKVALHNPTAERQAIKIKCSDNKIYRVSPVFAFIDAGATLDVEVFRDQGEPKLDKLVFVTSAAAASDRNPKYCFSGATAAKNNAPTAVLPLVA